jgi:NADH dehydrogenase
MSPIHIRDVAAIFVQSLDMPEAFGQTFVLCGPDALTWKSIIQTLARATGKKKMTVPAPVFAIKSAAALLEDYEFFPITRGQIVMLMQGNTGDSSRVFERFDIDPIHFDEASLAYLRQA